MPRIIVKSGYIQSGKHREYYANYIAIRDGVEKFKTSNGDTTHSGLLAIITLLSASCIAFLTGKKRRKGF